MRCADSVGTRQVSVTLSAPAIFGDQRLLSSNSCLYFLSSHPLIYLLFFFPPTAECNSTSANRKTMSAKMCKGRLFPFFKKRNNKYSRRRDILPLTAAERWKSQLSSPPLQLYAVSIPPSAESSTFFLSRSTIFSPVAGLARTRSAPRCAVEQPARCHAAAPPPSYRLQLFVLPQRDCLQGSIRD